MLEAFQSSLALAYCSAASSLVITSPSLTASHGCDCHLRSKPWAFLNCIASFVSSSFGRFSLRLSFPAETLPGRRSFDDFRLPLSKPLPFDALTLQEGSAG